MAETFMSYKNSDLSVKDSLTTDTLLNSSSNLRQSKVDEPRSAGEVVKQHSSEQIFDKNSNIKQLKFSTFFIADGKPKGQNTWNVNFPALSDTANFMNWRQENISDKSFEPPSFESSNQSLAVDACDKINMFEEDESLFESNKKSMQSRSKLKSDESSESRKSTTSSSGGDSSLKDEIPNLKTIWDFLRISDKQNANKPLIETFKSKPQNTEPMALERRETIPIIRDKVRKLKSTLSSPEVILKPKLRLGDLTNDMKSKKSKSIRRSLISYEMTQTSTTSNPFIKLIFFILVAIAAAIISSLWNEINENPFNFTNASLELQQSIHGQNDAINQLINHYNNSMETSNVVVLVGGTGVGKSYTGKIIMKYFPHKHNIFEYSPPLENDRETAVNYLSSMHCNLVIFEHLKLNHLMDLVKFVKLFNSKKPQPCTMVLAMINPEVTDNNLIKTMNLEESLNEINEAFSSVNIPIKTISFSPLTSDIIDICIKDEANKNDIHLTVEQLEEIKKHLLLTNSGCKGAYAKVQLYARK